MTKRHVKHQCKLLLMRDCMMLGKSYEASRDYFKTRGFSLGKTLFTELRNEIKSSKYAKEWFSKEALFVMEEDHMLSVERIRMMEDRVLQEFEQVSNTSYYSNWNTRKPNEKLIINKNHDADLLLRIITQFQSLQETKTKMFSATPLVQEMMEVHRRYEEETENLQ